MAFQLTADDLPDLVRGAAVLGTGGGGDPAIGRTLVAEAIRVNSPVTVIDASELGDDDFVIPTALMGAPSVLLERLPCGSEPVTALRTLERRLGRSATATMPIESGGINSTIPLYVSALTGLAVVDGDGMGRAFPELQMETFAIYGVNGSPLSIADQYGYTAVIETGSDNRMMEQFARAVTVRMGGVAYIAEYPMTGAEVKRTAIPGTLSLALRLGRCISTAREQHEDPVAALKETLRDTIYRYGEVLFTGKVVDVDRQTVEGFTRGAARIAAFDSDATCQIAFQNEYLTAEVDARQVATVPDLITTLHLESAEPITAESLRYGQRVCIFAIGTPDIMRTPEALAVFGPAAFGIDMEFVPVEQLMVSGGVRR